MGLNPHIWSFIIPPSAIQVAENSFTNFFDGTCKNLNEIIEKSFIPSAIRFDRKNFILEYNDGNELKKNKIRKRWK